MKLTQFKARKDGMPDLRRAADIGQISFETYEKEYEYLCCKSRFRQTAFLPTPEQIEEEKERIRLENEAKLELQEYQVEVRTHRPGIKVYHLDPSGQGGRHGKII